MTTKVFTDRSRVEQFQRCARSRWLGYHEAGMGITSTRKSLPLAVGGAVHEGLAVLLRMCQGGWEQYGMDVIENAAVTAALADFAAFDAGRLELDAGETATQDLSTLDEPAREKIRSDIDEYLYHEQRSLVEAMVRAYSRRRLRPLLEQYEVLEVEREGQWLLFAGAGDYPDELWFMSRPDALLRDRQSNDLYIQSFKTGASWDLRKGKDAEHDAQGLSEGVEIEKRLGEWWHLLHSGAETWRTRKDNMAVMKYLESCAAPPRILGIRYEFLWKGERRRDKDLTARFGVDMRSQSSHLVRGYLNAGMASGDEAWNWSWDYLKEGGETSKLYWKAWRGAAIWESMSVAKWIDMLDATVETVGEEGAARGWSGPAQATGFTEGHPLDLVFHPAIIVYRQEDDARDWIEQVEAQEVEIAVRVAQVRGAVDEGERRSLMNRYFRQSRHSCVYPSQCQFVAICYGGEDIRRDPLASGLYRIREANHPQERGGDE